jgi:hypothetical protein
MLKTLPRDFGHLRHPGRQILVGRRARGAVVDEVLSSARFTFLDVKEPFGELTAGELGEG